MGKNSPKVDPSRRPETLGDPTFHSWRTGFLPTKRNPHHDFVGNGGGGGGDWALRPADRRLSARSAVSRGGGGWRRSLLLSRRSVLFYCSIGAALFGLILLSIWLPGSINGGMRQWVTIRDGESPGRKVLRFVPSVLLRRFEEQGGLDEIRSEPRFGVRLPKLAIVLGSMERDSMSVMLLTIMKSIKELGYDLTVFTVKDGEARPFWEPIGSEPFILGPETNIDWSIFEGIVLSSLEVKVTISSLLQEPFDSIPLIWIIQEETLGKRLPLYAEMGWQHLISEWRRVFSRADVVVFPDFSLPMLYTALDTGNFFVIPGSPLDVWSAESYILSHSRHQLRKDNGLNKDDLMILVLGSSFSYDEMPRGFAAAMHLIGPQLLKLARTKNLGGSFKFAFLSGNPADSHDTAFQDIASRLGFPDGSVEQYGLDGDVNKLFLMADIVLYTSFQNEQSFPSLLVRAMSFGVPIIAPDLGVIKKYVVDEVNGFIFQANKLETLTTKFFLAISDMKLSTLAHQVAASGKLFSKNFLVRDCITGYANLLENVVHLPSDTVLPYPVSHIQQNAWEWKVLEIEVEEKSNGIKFQEFDEDGNSLLKSNIVYAIEEELTDKNNTEDASEAENEISTYDSPTESDWEDIEDMELSEDFDRREMEELEERIEKMSGSWEDIYSKSRKALKVKPEDFERDEGELERIGQHLCIYEIYSGAGAWPFLHHGALHRGLSLSKGALSSRLGDVDAVLRLPLLNNTYYKDLLCEYGGMLAIANRVDSIHKTPWIGFQSWRAAGRKVSLSVEAERILEDTLQAETMGDVFYYWARMDMQIEDTRVNENVSFWSMCDILNGGHCRHVFEDTFRLMYGLPNHIAALPPMPITGSHWSALNSWVMPTPSFLEFVMFSRMFVDSLDSINQKSSSSGSCLLGFSKLEKKHCYCRILEVLVNVWAYHSARKMVYLNPVSGKLEEQYPLEQRDGLMWVKYFNFTLLKSMDEELAEEADDDVHPGDRWLWPLTGEVHCQKILDREREERYRRKMDKHRKDREKQIERKRTGRSQKPLGR